MLLQIIFYIAAVPAIIYLALVAKERYKNQKDILFEFAAKNSFRYESKPKKVFREGSLFKVHKNGRSHTQISGIFGGLPFDMFAYHYRENNSRSQQGQSYTVFVMELTLPRSLPHMVIDSVVESRGIMRPSALPIVFDKSQRLKLGGGFYKSFEVYAPDNYAVTLLAIIAPNVMETLLEHATKYDIEIIGNKLYFYTLNQKSVGNTIMETFNTAEQVLDKIGKKLCTSNVYSGPTLAAKHDSVGSFTRLDKSFFSSLPGFKRDALITVGVFTVILTVLYNSTDRGIFLFFFWFLTIILVLSLLIQTLRAGLHTLRRKS